MNIAIVGAGTAGCSAAILLHKSGYAVTVFEKVPNPSPVGAGILLQQNGLEVLMHAQLHEEVLAAGVKVEQFLAKTPEGKKILNLRYKDLHPSFFGLGIHRGSFLSILLSRVQHLGIQILTGIDIREFRQQNGSLLIKSAAGEEFGSFDLLIIADGTRSELAGKITRVQIKNYRWGALWCYIPQLIAKYPDTLYQIYKGTKGIIGLLPTGTSAGKGTSIFWGIRLDQVDSWQKNSLDLWKKEVLKLTPLAEPLLEQLYDHGQFAVASYRDIRVSSFSNKKNIVLIGDAAHSMSPHLGQGANSALMDAYFLSKALSDNKNIGAALINYELQRKQQIQLYQQLSHYLFPFFQSEKEWLASFRNNLFPLLNLFPYSKRSMLEVFSGARKGWLS